jgi:hypothetical protein
MPAADTPELVGTGEGGADGPVLGGDGEGNADAGELERTAGAGLDPIVEPAPQAVRTLAPSRIAK